jgi:protein tyrosine/serine phosphatase
MSGFERLLSFDGIENFRDFGGYSAAGGRRLAAGRLYRSAHHGMASDADLTRVAALRLHSLVDLRRPTERARAPSRRPQGFSAAVIDNDLDDQPIDPYHTHLLESDHSVAAMRGFLFDYYRDALLERRHIDLFARYFHALADADGPVLIHCAAGKDRTGLLAALTHRLLGVSDTDMEADYLLTNDEARFARRAPQFAAFVQDLTGRAPSPEAIFVTMGVEAAYLHTAFDAVEAQYGSVEGYLETALGVDERLRDRIETRLLV